MNLVKIKCTFCDKEFSRSLGRVNEAKKFSWNQYCSRKCQNKAQVKKIEIKCANPSCSNKVFRLPSQLIKSKSGRIFCSLSCNASFNNSKFPKRKKERIVKKCAYCGKEFSRFGKEYCSKQCKTKAQIITKEQILRQIKEFYKKNERIPLKREFNHSKAAGFRFGTWNKAIKVAGFQPNPVLFAKKYIANDGHKCDSLSEKIIDDWLTVRKIKHQRNISYPENKSLTVDFVTKKYWIEFFGLAGEIKNYDRLLKKKQTLAKKYKLPLIEIYPKDLFPTNCLSEIIEI